MDAHQFDFLARSLTGPTRRRFSRALAGITLAGGLGTIAGPAEVDGKKGKGKKKNKKKKCKGGGKPIKGKCCQGSARVCIGGCSFPTMQDAVSRVKRRATITLCPGTYRERVSIFGKDVTLTGFGDGEGSGDTILENPGNVGAAVIVGPGAIATLQHLRLAGGSVPGFSVNGLQNNGTARLTDCTISGHKSTSLNSWGGGIDNRGMLSLTACTVSDNAAGTGGGIFNYGGNVSLTGCTISGNTTPLYGGGIWSDTTLVVTDSEISGNTAEADGGGIYSEGSLELVGCTVEGNTSHVRGGGIGTLEGTVTLDAACRVTGNTADDGGGIFNGGGTVTLSSAENVTGNMPDNCAGDAVAQCNG